MADDGGDLLILLLDTHVFVDSAHVDAQGAPTPKSVLEQVLYFISAYLMMNDHNQLAVYAVQAEASHLLYLSIGDNTPFAPEFSNPTKCITNKLKGMLEQYAGAGPASTLALSGALSRALCLVHRLRPSGGWGQASGPTRARPRVLCLVGTSDVPLQYISVMNAIFSAQRAEVAVDALVLGPPGVDSIFLQQAAHLTGGVYLRASSPDAPLPAGGAHGGPAAGGQGYKAQQPHRSHALAALQYLLSSFSTDTATRSLLTIHMPLGVDFRASCFCHKVPVDLGYVCSVCLSIFCQPTTACSICGTAFSEGPVLGKSAMAAST